MQKPFPELMRELTFDPLEMHQRVCEQLLLSEKFAQVYAWPAVQSTGKYYKFTSNFCLLQIPPQAPLTLTHVDDMIY